MEVIHLGNPIQEHWNWSGEFRFSEGEGRDTLSEISLDWPKHGFTHVDAPCHMIRGSLTLEDCHLRQLCGEAAVVDVSDCVPASAVNASILGARGGHVKAGDIIILRSNLNQVYPNTTPGYWEKSPYLDASGAQWIVERGCVGLAIDFPQDYVVREMSDRLVKNHEMIEHHIVLGAKMMHLEHLVNLDRIKQDRIFLVGWPLRLPNADGGPASPVALTEWPSASPGIIDLSLPIQADWRQRVKVILALSFEKGDQVQETGVHFVGHSHTHCLTPKYIDPTLKSLDSLIGERLVRDAQIVDLSDTPENGEIDINHLERRAHDASSENILVLRTGYMERVPYSDEFWPKRSPFLAGSAAEWIAKEGFDVVAVDFEIDEGRKRLGARRPRKTDLVAERILLENGVSIVKNLTNLTSISNSRFFMVGMPLYLPGAESAPSRVLGLQW